MGFSSKLKMAPGREENKVHICTFSVNEESSILLSKSFFPFFLKKTFMIFSAQDMFINSSLFFSFVCDNCLKKTGRTRKENKFSAKSKFMVSFIVY